MMSPKAFPLVLLLSLSIGTASCGSLPQEADSTAATAVPEDSVPSEPLAELTIDRLLWSDSDEWPEPIQQNFAGRDVLLHAHVVEWEGFALLKNFTSRADKSVRLVGDDGSEVRLHALTGGMTTADGSLRFVSFRPVDALPAAGSNVTYRLAPRNQAEGAEWVVLPGVRVSR